MAPLNPPQNFKFLHFFSQKEYAFVSVASSSQETPNPLSLSTPLFKANLWISTKKNKWK
jgi:hypothetical protein